VAREFDVAVGERRIRVRDAGDPEGTPVLFFHGLGDSRLDLRLSEPLAEQLKMRLVSFDRPGYGSSTPAEFDLLSIARDTEAVADRLGSSGSQCSGSPRAVASRSPLRRRLAIGFGALGARPAPDPFTRCRAP
jgi:alpha-beta hydrolase superfamily lysophospholipase